MSSSPTIASPATLPNPNPNSFEVGQEIALILNKTDLIPGVVVQINPDETFDLECEVPCQVRKLRWKGAPGRSEFNIGNKLELETRPFLRARPIDPRAQVYKAVSSLASLGIPLPDKESIIQQSSISMWRFSGKTIRVPKLTDFYAPLVGGFFDPSLFYYKLICWRAAMNLRGIGVVPEETRYFPNPTNPSKPPYYTSFRKCFDRYVKEYLSNLEKWNRVQMQAILPEDVLVKET